MGAGICAEDVEAGEVPRCEGDSLLVAVPETEPAPGSEGLETEASVLIVASELERLCARRLSVI